MITRICPALSTGGCDVATVDGDDLICESFTAILRDPVRPVSPATDVTLQATDQEVDVVHDDPSTAMTADQHLWIAQHADGYWFVIKWIC